MLIPNPDPDPTLVLTQALALTGATDVVGGLRAHGGRNETKEEEPYINLQP